jgi:hypothetical protein
LQFYCHVEGVKEGMFEHTARKPSGYMTITKPDGKVKERDTVQCCHCMYTWMIEPGSGRERGWCGTCGKITCGKKECGVCVPFMKAIEEAEERDRMLRNILGG